MEIRQNVSNVAIQKACRIQVWHTLLRKTQEIRQKVVDEVLKVAFLSEYRLITAFQNMDQRSATFQQIWSSIVVNVNDAITNSASIKKNLPFKYILNYKLRTRSHRINCSIVITDILTFCL